MNRAARTSARLIACAALLTVQCTAQDRSSGTAEPFSVAWLAEPPVSSWPTNGGNLFNQRYSPLALIDRDNVGGLGGVWRTHLRGSGIGEQYSGSAQPLIDDGVIYIVTGANDVFALDFDTGEILWDYEAGLDPGLTSVCCGWTSRGVALSDDKVFVGRLDARLVALDRTSGEVVWDVATEAWEDNFSITSAPLYYDGMVITGFAGADRGTRGRVKAYAADTGAHLWTFYTIPGPGEAGHETWPADNDAWQYGGGAVWQTPAVDPELGLLYFSTGNAGPNYNGAARAGDNLFTVSIVAIDAATGEYRWHFQQVHHDLWDYDASNPVVLMDLEIDGATRRAVVEVGKTGWAYILDRATGEPIVGIDERPVPQQADQATAATQPFPRGDSIVPQQIDIAPEGYELVNAGAIFTPFIGDERTIVKPGAYGGANWPPSSYDPERQLLFVCASSVIGTYWGGGDPEVELPGQGQRYVGGNAGFAAGPRTGIFAALDATTNTLAWRYRWPEQCYSGSVATGGGLVFVGRSDGRLTALDSDTGRQLWEFQTGAGMHAPASVVEHNGQQYVVAYSAGNRLAGSVHGDSVWLFALGGSVTPASADPVVLPQVSATASSDQLFADICSACHGADGRGGPGGGPTLAASTNSAEVARIVRDGLTHMPAFGALLTEDQIGALGSFVTEQLSSDAE